MGYRKQKQVELTERRAKVARLYAQRLTMTEIGQLLGVHSTTIVRDIAAILEEWRREAADELGKLRAQELLELNDMEREIAKQYRESVNADARDKQGWIDARLKVKARRAKLTGLDAPVKAAIGGIKEGEPIKLRFDFSGLSPELVRRLAEEPDEGDEECFAGTGPD